MTRASLLVGLFLCFTVFADEEKPAAAAAAPAASAEAPKAEEKKYTGEAAAVKAEMEALFDASRKVNGAEKSSARAKIENALDWDRVAKECLGAEYKKAGKGNLGQFKNLLKEVITKTAYTRMDTFWNGTNYSFDTIDVKGSEAHVKATFNVKSETFALDYYLAKKGSKWWVYDIAFEDLRYSTNISEQIVAFLREKPFSALLTSLKKRRDDLESGKRKG